MRDHFAYAAGFSIEQNHNFFLGTLIIFLLLAFLYMVMSSQKKAGKDKEDGNKGHFIRLIVGLGTATLFIAFYITF